MVGAQGRSNRLLLKRRMTMPQSILLDEVCAQLPLFEDLPRDAPERLAAAGLGRGLLTASVRARLRKAGFVDMAALALATPAELMRVRKIGPVRLQVIRAHVLDELARIYPDARRFHGLEATAARRLGRLRRMPAERLILEEPAIAELGRSGTGADLSARSRAECLKMHAITAGVLDRMVVALVRFLLLDKPRLPVRALEPTSSVTEADERAARLRVQQERDRAWEEADPQRPRRVRGHP